MLRLSLKAKAKVITVLVATTSVLTLGNTALTTHSAGADPQGATARNGGGSDTIQDVMDAFSGANPGPSNPKTNYFTPVIHGIAADGFTAINSWDAIPFGGTGAAPGCIITTYGGAAFDRPNGSGNGIRVLSHANDPTGNTKWYSEEPTVGGGPTNPVGTSCTHAPVDVSKQIDFARSSSGPANNTMNPPQLTYFPFGRDGVGFAYFDHMTGHAATLSSAQLQALYNNAGATPGRIQVPNGTGGFDTVLACITQKGSGTTKFWEKALGVTDAQAQAASAASGCTPSGSSTLEENGGDSFFAFANAQPAGTDAVVDFSAASWISQANPATAVDRSSMARGGGVDLGTIDDGGGNPGKPYVVNAGVLAPNPTFYTSGTYGRNVFIVVPTKKLSGISTKDQALIDLFSGNGSVICSAAMQPTLNKFGFLSLAAGTCGVGVGGNFYDTPGGMQTT